MGPDNISPYFLRTCAKEITPPITIIFKNCLRENIWPKSWKHARVTPVHKKSSNTHPDNYRPISILAGVSKIFERIRANYIEDFLICHRLIFCLFYQHHGMMFSMKGKTRWSSRWILMVPLIVSGILAYCKN